MPSWIRAPPESLRPMTGAPALTAISMTLHIFAAMVSDMEPPFTVKSCAYTYTRRPSMVPIPVTTPSPSYLILSVPKFVQRCCTNISNSSKLPSSSSRAILSRAVSLPFWCWASMRFCPPPNFAAFLRSINSFIFSITHFFYERVTTKIRKTPIMQLHYRSF